MCRPEGEKSLGRSGRKWENNVKNRSSLSGMARYGLNASGPEKGNLSGACGYCNFSTSCGSFIFAESICSTEIERRLFNKIMPRQTVQVNKLFGERR